MGSADRLPAALPRHRHRCRTGRPHRPRPASFTIALATAQNLLANAGNILDDTTDLTGQIGQAVLAEPAPLCRLRVSARKVKSALSRYNKADPYRPARSTKIDTIHASITSAPTKHH
jgi:hypothetical protein